MRNLLLLLALAAPAYCAPAVVQGCGNAINATAQTSITCTFASNIGAGHVLYFCYSGSNTATTWSGDSGTFTADPGSGTAITNTSWWDGWVTCVYVPSAGGGTSVITATWSSSNNPSIAGFELSGVGVLDKSDAGINYGTNTTAPLSASITPTANGDLLIGVGFATTGAYGATTLTAGTNVAWAASTTAKNAYAELFETFTQATAAAVTANFTASPTSTAWAHIVSFKALASVAHGFPVVF